MANPSERDRPDLPEGYIPPEVLARPDGDGLLDWVEVDGRLREAKHYWMSTTRPDGRPHVVPRWGAWIDGALFYDGSPETVHANNLRTNAACSMHIGDGAEAIIIEGTSQPSEPLDADAGRPVAAEIGRKYGADGYAPESDAWSGPDAGGLAVFTPNKGLAWYDFPNDLTRFRF